MAKKKFNISKAVKKATKSIDKAVIKPTEKVATQAAQATSKAVVQPAMKTVVQPAVEATKTAVIQPAMKTVVQPAVQATKKAVIQPAAKAVTKMATPKKGKKGTASAAAAAAKAEANAAKRAAAECEQKSKLQKTEITNLKYQITAADKEKADYINRINTMTGTITTLNNQIGSLNNKVATLDNRINGPLVVKKEGFSTLIEGFPANPEKMKRGDPYVDYALDRSGLKPAATDYKRMYGNYYAGYEDNETMIQDVLMPQIDYLSATDLDGMEYSYAAVHQQNKTLESQIENTADEYSTDFQKAKYVEEEMTSVKKRNAILFFGFYLLLVIFAYAFFTESDLSIPMKTGILAVLFVYPYWIGYITRTLFFIYTYMSALFRGVPL